MRDPKRIDKILDRIKDIWHRHPDMRFGQLLINLQVVPDGPVWHQEDDKVEALLAHKEEEQGW